MVIATLSPTVNVQLERVTLTVRAPWTWSDEMDPWGLLNVTMIRATQATLRQLSEIHCFKRFRLVRAQEAGEKEEDVFPDVLERVCQSVAVDSMEQS